MRGTQQRLGLVWILTITAAVLSSSYSNCQEPSPQALYDQAGSALDAGNTAQAIKLYEALLQQAPNSIEARTNLGVALAHEGRYDEAVQQYRQVLSRDPQNETALLNLALGFYKQGNFSAAHDEFDKLHTLHPANQQGFYLLADCDLRLGKFRDAIALTEPVYQAHPEDPAIDYILGTALIQDGQTQKGAEVIDRMMRNGDSAVASTLIGASQFAARDYKSAASTLRKALDLNPVLPGAWTIYGRALLGNGENEEPNAGHKEHRGKAVQGKQERDDRTKNPTQKRCPLTHEERLPGGNSGVGVRNFVGDPRIMRPTDERIPNS